MLAIIIISAIMRKPNFTTCPKIRENYRATRKVLNWRLTNTLDTRFCAKALKEALFKYGAPEIFNSEQGCQFTSDTFTSVLKTWDIRISMDGKGRFKDNIFVERLWRMLKYERIYLNVYETGTELSNDMTY
jgi:putative transposase